MAKEGKCTAFAKKNGIEVLREHVDRAISGMTDRRPDFQRMIRDSENHAFGNVIVWKRDRFSRDCKCQSQNVGL